MHQSIVYPSKQKYLRHAQMRPCRIKRHANKRRSDQLAETFDDLVLWCPSQLSSPYKHIFFSRHATVCNNKEIDPVVLDSSIAILQPHLRHLPNP